VLDNVKIIKNNISDRMRVVRFISTVIGRELFNITRGCYYLKNVKYDKELENVTGVNDIIIKQFKKSMPEEFLYISPEGKKGRAILTDKRNLGIIYNLISYLKNKDYEMALLFSNYLALRFYGNVIHLYMKEYCNAQIWALAMDKISPRHVFKIKSGISNSLIYFSEEEFKKLKLKFIELNKKLDQKSEAQIWDVINKYVYALRHRINQSFKAFANIYHDLIKDENIIVKVDTEEEEGGEQSEIQDSYIDKITNSICTYREVDKTSLSEAIKKSGIRGELGIYIINKISDVNIHEDIKFIIMLLNKIIPLKSICQEKNKNFLIRKIILNSNIMNKYFIKNIILDLIKRVDDNYYLTTINESQLVVFFANYIVLYIKNRIC